MGRAIIRNPKAFLFDEPLSNLDAALRVHMRAEIRKLHNSLGATSVYVTHDQIEAMTMADHVVVMRAGVIEQQGAPLELYDRPVNRFVAGFIGSPAMNFVAAIAAEDGRTLVLNFGGKSEPQTIMSPVAFTPGARVTVGIRPEHITLAPPGSSTITLPVGIVETTGSATSVTTATQPEMTVALQGRSNVKAGDSVGFNIDPASLHLFDHETEQRL